MSQPIDIAYVKILPDLSDFDRQLKRDLDKSFSNIEKSAARAATDIEKDFKKSFGNIGKDVGRSGSDIGTKLGKSVQSNVIGSLGDLGQQLGGAFRAAGAAAIPVAIFVGTQLAGAIGPAIVALGAALPTAIGVASAAIGTLIVGFQGIGDAVKNFDDIDKYNEALKKLSPSARAFVNALKDLMPTFGAIRTAVQESLFAGLDARLRSVTAVLSGPLKTGASDVAGAFNLVAREFSAFLTSTDGVTLVKNLFAGTAEIIRELSTAIRPLAKGFADLVTAALPFVQVLTQAAAGALTRFGEKLSELAASGDLNAFFDRALETLEKLGKLGVNVFEILIKVLTAAGPSGQSLIDNLIKITDLMATVLDDEDTVKALGVAFSVLGAILTTNILVVVKMKEAADAFIAVFPKIKKAVEDAIDAVADFGRSVASWFGRAFDAVSEFVVSVGRWFAALPGRIADFVSKIPGAIAGAFELAFNAALHAIGVGIGLVLAAVLVMPGRIIDALSRLPGLINGFFVALWNSVWQFTVNAWNGTILPFIKSIPGLILGAVVGLAVTLGNFFVNLWVTIKNGAISGFNAVIDFIKSVPDRIMALGSFFLNAGINLIKSFVKGISSGGGFVGDVAGSITGAIKGFLNNVIDRINGGINSVGSALHVKLPNIPRLARGAIATGPTVAEIGEAGDEAVLPLSGQRGRRTFEMIAQAATNNAPVINFGPGSIAVEFSGVLPTETQARQVGESVGLGIAAVLAKRDIRMQVRTA